LFDLNEKKFAYALKLKEMQEIGYRSSRNLHTNLLYRMLKDV